MTRRQIDTLFKNLKEKFNLDYAITMADEYGDCSTCITDAIHTKHGRNSKGVWLKHWRYGMNKSGSIESQEPHS